MEGNQKEKNGEQGFSQVEGQSLHCDSVHGSAKSAKPRLQSDSAVSGMLELCSIPPLPSTFRDIQGTSQQRNPIEQPLVQSTYQNCQYQLHPLFMRTLQVHFPPQSTFHHNPALRQANSYYNPPPSISHVPPVFRNRKLRSGKWTPEEEAYTEILIEMFEKGYVNERNGCTLRAFLSRKLHCAPMRISKKYARKGIGKLVFVSRNDRSGLNTLSCNEYRGKMRRLQQAESDFLKVAFPEFNMHQTSIPKPNEEFTKASNGLTPLVPNLYAATQIATAPCVLMETTIAASQKQLSPAATKERNQLSFRARPGTQQASNITSHPTPSSLQIDGNEYSNPPILCNSKSLNFHPQTLYQAFLNASSNVKRDEPNLAKSTPTRAKTYTQIIGNLEQAYLSAVKNADGMSNSAAVNDTEAGLNRRDVAANVHSSFGTSPISQNSLQDSISAGDKGRSTQPLQFRSNQFQEVYPFGQVANFVGNNSHGPTKVKTTEIKGGQIEYEKESICTTKIWGGKRSRAGATYSIRTSSSSARGDGESVNDVKSKKSILDGLGADSYNIFAQQSAFAASQHSAYNNNKNAAMEIENLYTSTNMRPITERLVSIDERSNIVSEPSNASDLCTDESDVSPTLNYGRSFTEGLVVSDGYSNESDGTVSDSSSRKRARVVHSKNNGASRRLVASETPR